MKRQSNSTTLGQLPTFADYRRMRLLQPRRDSPTPDKEVQGRIKNIKQEHKGRCHGREYQGNARRSP